MHDKRAFVKELAKYLVEDQVKKGILLQMGKEEGTQWAALRSSTPLLGYPTVPEAEKQLQEFLGFDDE